VPTPCGCRPSSRARETRREERRHGLRLERARGEHLDAEAFSIHIRTSGCSTATGARTLQRTSSGVPCGGGRRLAVGTVDLHMGDRDVPIACRAALPSFRGGLEKLMSSKRSDTCSGSPMRSSR